MQRRQEVRTGATAALADDATAARDTAAAAGDITAAGSSASTHAATPPVGVSLTRGIVTVQLPAWAFAFAIAALVALIAWLAAH